MRPAKKLLGKTETVHFIGIGGSGMNGIARVLLTLGYRVRGSDLAASETTRGLVRAGARIFIGHRRSHVRGSDVVVYSSAVDRNNPEMREARERGIPVIPRAEMLSELMRLKRGVAVAGTHGKTTTSSLIGHIFLAAGLKPTVLIGGKVLNMGAHARLGKGDFLICEADESDGSFLKLSPESVVVTNIDNDHLDYYGSMKNLESAFVHFINKVPFYGFAVLCRDDRRLRTLFPQIKRRVITYGFSPDSDFVIVKENALTFRLKSAEGVFGPVRMNKPGSHNMQNTAAAVITGLEFGLPLRDILKAVSGYRGVERRMELLGTARGIRVMDDYGHHPTEIKATLEAVSSRRGPGRLIVIFQPHRYSRTRLLYKEFARVFRKADILFITDVYAAGEKRIPGVTGRLIQERTRKYNRRDNYYVPALKQIPERIRKLARPGDLVLTLGAGDIKFLGKEILMRLK